MPSRDALDWSSRLQTGVGLYALALICLVIVAPNGVGICSAIGGAATLALFGVTGARALVVALTVLLLAVFTCGLFAAVTLHSFVLLSVVVVLFVVVVLL